MYCNNVKVLCPLSFPSALDLFTRFCYQKDLPRAIALMETLQKHGKSADSLTYSELIKCCLTHGSISQGKLIHEHLFSNGNHPNTFLINCLLNMYVKFDFLKEARKLFDKMPNRNVVSWTTMISAFSGTGLNDTALEFLILMLRDGVRPNMFTYSSVLRSCFNDGSPSLSKQLHGNIVKAGLYGDPFVQSALIDIYSRWGDLQNALLVFNEVTTQDPDIWNSIIGGFAQNNNGYKALFLFKNMGKAGVPYNRITLTSTLRACTGLALLELGRQVHVHVHKIDDKNLILNNALLDMYCKCGSLDDANAVFSEMVYRDAISWSTMIAGFAQNGYSLKALDLFQSMKASGCKPNYITMVGTLFACSHAGLIEDGWYYFRSMKKLFGIDPGNEHYGCMIDLLGRAGRFNDALSLMDEMGRIPDAIMWRTLLSACKVHQNLDLAIHAAKQVLLLDPEDSGTYILLSNMYANLHRWEDVKEVRRTMRVKGVNKEPGCSWIEVDKLIHAFSLGDMSHPQLNQINERMDQLYRRLMEVGYVAETNFVLHDLEGEQKEESLRYHSEKLAIVFGLINVSRQKTIRIMKNLRICGDCHVFAKYVSKVEERVIVIRDVVRYHHFKDGVCSCGDYW